jgi:hypothetical protein
MDIRWILLMGALLLSENSAAADSPTAFADWYVGTADDKSYVFAATTNDSGDSFGEYCYFKTGKCNWLIGMHTNCKTGQTGVVLANSDSNSAALDIYCYGPVGDIAAYGFQNWKSLEGTLKDASRVGFAVPLEADKFKVVRFSLTGRMDATTQVETYFSEQVKNQKPASVTPKQGTRTETL